jgi:hypothetical protein
MKSNNIHFFLKKSIKSLQFSFIDTNTIELIEFLECYM